MNSIQEALRELRAEPLVEDLVDKTSSTITESYEMQLVEAKKSRHENTLRDLWDQVYCSLTDGGYNNTYKALGKLNGKGKYDVAEVGGSDIRPGFDTIVVTNPNTDAAEEVAKVYGLEYRIVPGKRIYIYVPEGAPVNTDLLTPAWRDAFVNNTKAPAGSEEDIDEGVDRNATAIPAPYDKYFEIVDPSEIEFEEGMYAIGDEIEDNAGLHILAYLCAKPEFADSFDSDAFLVDDEQNPVVQIGGQNNVLPIYVDDLKTIFSDELTEDVASSMPVTILPHDEVYNYIENVPEATADRPPFFFPVGYIKELGSEIPSKFRGGRGSEGNPNVRIFKCSEMTVYTGADYENLKATKAYRKETGKERSGERTGFSFGGDTAIVDRIGISARGEEQLQCYVRKGTKPRVKYFISLDDEDLREASREEVAEYLTPAQANRVLGNVEVADGPEGAKVVRLKLSGIYRIGNLGHSVM